VYWKWAGQHCQLQNNDRKRYEENKTSTKLVIMAQFSTIEVLVAMPMTRWEFKIVPCLAGENASATYHKMLVMRFSNVQWPAPLSLLLRFGAQYKCHVIIQTIVRESHTHFRQTEAVGKYWIGLGHFPQKKLPEKNARLIKSTRLGAGSAPILWRFNICRRLCFVELRVVVHVYKSGLQVSGIVPCCSIKGH